MTLYLLCLFSVTGPVSVIGEISSFPLLMLVWRVTASHTGGEHVTYEVVGFSLGGVFDVQFNMDRLHDESKRSRRGDLFVVLLVCLYPYCLRETRAVR